VGTTETPGGALNWSDALTNPEGTLLNIDLQQRITFELAGFATLSRNTFGIAIETVPDAALITRVFQGVPPSGPVVLRHVTGYGTFHRLVVEAGALRWEHDVVIRQAKAMVRFITGTVEMETVTDLHVVAEVDGKPTLEGGQGTERATGRFVEIIAPGGSEHEAQLRAQAILGIVALALGENALGRVRSSERWEATPTGQQGIALVSGAAFSQPLTPADFGTVDTLLGSLVGAGSEGRARAIALRWYERGLRSDEPLDMLLSFHIGVEALVSAFYKVSAPIPAEAAREAENDSILQALKTLGKKVMGRVAQRISGASIREQFAYYASKQGLGSEAMSRFEKTKSVRDGAVHGEGSDVAVEVAREGEKLLREMLKAELAFGGQLPQERMPSVFQMRLAFQLVSAGSPAESGNVAPNIRFRTQLTQSGVNDRGGTEPGGSPAPDLDSHTPET